MGHNAGITFNKQLNNPTALTDGLIFTDEGCSTVSNANGDLLFYTDGITIWNRQHDSMPNGRGLHGHFSSATSSLVIEDPGDSNSYYIFTLDYGLGPNGLQYSIVNMALDNGLGDVILKNNPINYNVTEKQTAVRHSNKKDIWIIEHERNSNNFLVYLLTSNGLNLKPIISSAGTSMDDLANWLGILKSSPDGKKIVTSVYTPPTIELFDFDNNTGIISNPIIFSSRLYEMAYGLEFSPDCSKLYVVNRIGPSNLYQFNLNAGSVNNIINSRILISTYPDWLYYGGLQLGQNGKIYHAKYNAQYLGVINYPDSLGLACDYVDDGVFLAGKTTGIGLPNFLPSYFEKSLTPKPSITSTHIGQPCIGDTIILEADLGFVSYEWYNATTNQLVYSGSRIFIVVTSGNYYVKVKDANGNEGVSDIVNVTIGSVGNQLQISSILCNGYFTFDSTYYPLLNCKNIKLINSSATQFTLSQVYLEHNIWFSVPMSQFPIIFQPGESKNLLVCYSPTQLGTQTDSLYYDDVCGKQLIPLKALSVPNTTLATGKCNTNIILITKKISQNSILNISNPLANSVSGNITFTYSMYRSFNYESSTECYLYNAIGEKKATGSKQKIMNATSNDNLFEEGEIYFDINDFSSGLYFIVLKSQVQVLSCPILIIR
jgi:hypothetical protein